MKIIKFYNTHLIQLLCVSIIILSTCISFMKILNIVTVAAAASASATTRVRCETPDMIPNGSYRLRRNNMIMRVSCNIGFQLQGYRLISCIRGKWYEEKPVCAKKGCTEILKSPENGRIHIQNDIKAILYCLDDYTLAGNRVTFCNGTLWDRPIGNCRPRNNTVQHFCDFETDDVCGWVYEPHDGLEWKRVVAARVFKSFRTGPRFDHTTQTANGGHYMLMESLTRQNTLVTLTSPVYQRDLTLKTACCFQFYYFMYGSGVGTLYVIVKPVSIPSINEILRNRTHLIKFQKTGNQNNLWNEAYFNIEELDEDFQIIFAAKGGLGHLSDIAIDDVHLMTGQQCKNFDKVYSDYSTTEIYQMESTIEPYESIYDTQSCVGRCNDTTTAKGVMFIQNHLVELCSCTLECEELDTCCPDFKTICLNEIFVESSTTELVHSSFTGREIMSDEIVPPMTEKFDRISTTIQESLIDDFTPNKPLDKTSTTTTSRSLPETITQIIVTNTTAKQTIPLTSTTAKPTTVTFSEEMTTTTAIKQSSPIIFNKVERTTRATTQKPTYITRKPITTMTAMTTTAKTRATTATTASQTTSQKIEITSTHALPTTPITTTRATTRATTFNTKTTSMHFETAEPIWRTTLSMPLIPLNNNSDNNTKKNTVSTFIINTDNQIYPDDIHNHTRVFYWIAIFVVITIIVVLSYRTCGGQAVAWYRIYFYKHERDDDEISSLNDHLITETTFEQSTSTSASTSTSTSKLFSQQRGIAKDVYSKIKLQWRRRSNGKDDMKMPLWKTVGNEDEDEDENIKHNNSNIHTTTLNNKLFTEL